MIVGLSILITSCSEEPLPENASFAAEKSSKSPVSPLDKRPEIIITNVVKVFMHEPPSHYSVMSLGKQGKLVFHDLNMSSGVTIYADVPTDKPMWVSYRGESGYNGLAEIHIHDALEINGAGWTESRGKTTVCGTTTEVH